MAISIGSGAANGLPLVSSLSQTDLDNVGGAFDLNGDNTLDPTEAKKLNDYLAGKDTNGDGKLDPAELKKAESDLPPPPSSNPNDPPPSGGDPNNPPLSSADQKYLDDWGNANPGPDWVKLKARFDRDGSGDLDPNEKRALISYIKSQSPNVSLNPDQATVDKSFDGLPTSDNNSKYAYGVGNTKRLDWLEGAMKKGDIVSGWLYKKLVEKFDKNGDGKLTGEERAAAEAYLATKDADGKGFGPDDAKSALNDIGNLTQDSVDGFFAKVKNGGASGSGGGDGSGGGVGGSGDGSGGGVGGSGDGSGGGVGGSGDGPTGGVKIKIPSVADVIKDFPPEVRALIAQFL